ncbi:hypothetical protein KIH07_21305 [Hydrogenophaga taeniospiralis]|jgi:hypothetical protein|uniref:hypothetical protein n=1 Tax=Hydrogenophaga taeniospiralis TaxID=65656 RepID=UPI001CFB693D|nr:hypothetical protein [Hydrogenophaga taeniospiralis]MCB4366281.1 hypothetical protein [Hydrogenophaga taeniospiralis]
MSEPMHPTAAPGTAPGDEPDLTNTELVQLRMRVIALENMVVALLADATPRQQALAREMASYISPRPGYTPHTLTIHAADQMRSLVDRADRFQPMQGN